jgi:AraC-like DNA-binding protein
MQQMRASQQVFFRNGVTGTRLASRAQFARHTHDSFGIGVIERGTQRSWSGRGPVEAGPGDLITVNACEVHDGAPIGTEGRHWRMLYFDPAVIGALAHDLSELRDDTLEFKAPVFGDPVVARRRFLTLFRRLSTGGEIDDIACEAALLELLSLISVRAARVSAKDCPIRRAKDFIDAHPERRICLETLAHLSGASKFQFLRAFSRATGLTPHAYIVQARLQRAKRLITAGEALAAVALRCGFADQSHLTRVFARSYGFTPGRAAISFKNARSVGR